MLCWSKQRSAPSPEGASACRTRARRYACRRRKSTRSSKSTCMRPGAWIGRSQLWRGSASPGVTTRGSTLFFFAMTGLLVRDVAGIVAGSIAASTGVSPAFSACRLHFPLDSLRHAQSPRIDSIAWMPAHASTEARRRHLACFVAKNVDRAAIAAYCASRVAPKPGCRVAPAEGGLAMDTLSLDRLGNEIAELAAHLEAATARLLDLIRQFDARGGWGNGFRSCAHWLSWRVGLDIGAAREKVRVARALGTLPRLARALARGELSYAKVRALTRVATPETEERLLAVGRAGTAEHVERIVRGGRG